MSNLSKEQGREAALSTEHLRKGLKDRAIKSVGFTLFAQAVKVVLQLISIVVLARLLEPSDFGLVAMVAVFSGLAKSFMDGGLAMATVQKATVTHSQVSNLFWINSFLGAALFVAAIPLSRFVASVYSEPKLILITIGLSLSFLVGGLSIQHDAVLQRQMKFRVVALVDVFSMAIGVVSAIFTAVYGLSYWALVVLPVMTEVSKTLLRWVLSGWSPSRFKSKSGTKSLIRFGTNITAADTVGYFVSNATPFFVGYLGGAQPLGYYNRSFQIASMPTTVLLPPIMSVLRSTLSRIVDDERLLKVTILSLLKKIAFVCFFVSTCMVIMSDWIVVLVLGDEWREAIPMFAVLSMFTVSTPISSFIAVTLISVGEARALLRWRLYTICILLISLSIGYQWGVIGLVWSMGLSAVIVRVPLLLIFSTQFLPVCSKEFAKTLAPVIIVAIVTSLVLSLLRTVYEPASILAGMGLYTALAFALYFGSSLVIGSLRSELFDLLAMSRKMLLMRRQF